MRATVEQMRRRNAWSRGPATRVSARPMPLPPAPRRRIRTRKNQKRGLNENYGRELMELHTLGVDGGYTQQDVH